MATPAEATSVACDLFEAGRSAEAETLARRVLDAAPGFVPATWLLGVILCASGRFEEAVPVFEPAATRSANVALTMAKALVRLENADGAERAARLSLSLDPLSAEAWDLAAAIARRGGDLDAAVAGLERAVRLDPASTETVARLALLLRERGARRLGALDLKGAVEDSRRAVGLSPLDGEARNTLGSALFESGRIEAARECFRRTIALAPDAGGPHRGLGIASLRAGEEAVRVLERAAGLSPADPAPLEVLTQALLDLDPTRARVWSSRALAVKSAREAVFGDDDPPALRAADGPRRRMIAFSLWGDLVVYLNGALAMVESARARLPGWGCRYYHDDSVPAGVLEELRARGAELVARPAGEAGRLGMFWRFLPLDDPSVERVLPRDCDSLLTEREVAAIEAWVASGIPFHAMRDHVMHMEPLMGGMWGAVTGELPSVEPAIRRFERERPARWNDQHFLAEWMWPRVAGRVLVHDDVHPEAGLPFPSPGIPAEGHVGAKVFPLTRMPSVVPEGDPRIARHVAALGEWMGLERRLFARLEGDTLRVVADRLDADGFERALEGHPVGVHLKIDDPAGEAEATRRLMSAGYRAWRLITPAFDPANPKGARVPPEPGLIAVAVLALRDGREPPIPLVPMTRPNDDWRPAAWRLRWDGSARV